jgi:hypothetical protein
MNEAARNAVAEALENLARQKSWNPAVWQRCVNLVRANWDDELIEFVHHDLIRYDNMFHLGFPIKPGFHSLRDYRREFRAVAFALRKHLSFVEAKKQLGFLTSRAVVTTSWS